MTADRCVTCGAPRHPRLMGYINPDGTSRGNWYGREPHGRRHLSEKLVVDRIGRRYNRRQAEPVEPLPGVGPSTDIRGLPDTRIPPVRLLNYLLAVAFLEVMVIVWALSELGVLG